MISRIFGRDQTQVRTTLAGMVGNILEWYDFALYGYLAVVLSHVFFPADGIGALISTYGVFAIGFLMRPLGAVLFGFIGDRFGRRKALFFSVILMVLPTFAIGILPTYASIGITATILLVAIRLLQGLSVGGEFSSSVTYMVENAPQNRRGLFGSWSNVGSIAGMLLGVATATIVTASMGHDALYSWGWRLPFLAVGIIGMIAIYLRRHLPPSHVYSSRHATDSPLTYAIRNNWREILETILFAMGYAVLFYTALVYLPTFLDTYTNMDLDHALRINTGATALLLLLIPLAGFLSDVFLRRTHFLAAMFVIAIAGMVPLFSLLATGSLYPVILAHIGLMVLIAAPLGQAPALFVEQFPTRDRLTAYSITYNIGLGVFGGTTPMIATWLIDTSGNIYAPAYYATMLLAISTIALLFMRERSREALR